MSPVLCRSACTIVGSELEWTWEGEMENLRVNACTNESYYYQTKNRGRDARALPSRRQKNLGGCSYQPKQSESSTNKNRTRAARLRARRPGRRGAGAASGVCTAAECRWPARGPAAAGDVGQRARRRDVNGGRPLRFVGVQGAGGGRRRAVGARGAGDGGGDPPQVPAVCVRHRRCGSPCWRLVVHVAQVVERAALQEVLQACGRRHGCSRPRG